MNMAADRGGSTADLVRCLAQQTEQDLVCKQCLHCALALRCFDGLVVTSRYYWPCVAVCWSGYLRVYSVILSIASLSFSIGVSDLIGESYYEIGCRQNGGLEKAGVQILF